jgi:hypothetical protein
VNKMSTHGEPDVTDALPHAVALAVQCDNCRAKLGPKPCLADCFAEEGRGRGEDDLDEAAVEYVRAQLLHLVLYLPQACRIRAHADNTAACHPV